MSTPLSSARGLSYFAAYSSAHAYMRQYRPSSSHTHTHTRSSQRRQIHRPSPANGTRSAGRVPTMAPQRRVLFLCSSPRTPQRSRASSPRHCLKFGLQRDIPTPITTSTMFTSSTTLSDEINGDCLSLCNGTCGPFTSLFSWLPMAKDGGPTTLKGGKESVPTYGYTRLGEFEYRLCNFRESR